MEPPRFFLERTPDEGAPELVEADRRHALRVLRLAPGDRLTGVDGRGGAWPLVVSDVRRGALSLESVGEPTREPAPGAPGAPLPWITLAVAWPRATRAETMLGGLVQLGVAEVVPLVARFAGPGAAAAAGKRERHLRILREACKQARRAWLPRLAAPCAPAGLLDGRPGPAAFGHPGAHLSLADWARDLPAPPEAGTSERPLVVAVGPEGGFDPDERDALLSAGAREVALGPHVLRIETAALAAAAVLAALRGA